MRPCLIPTPNPSYLPEPEPSRTAEKRDSGFQNYGSMKYQSTPIVQASERQRAMMNT